MSTETRGDTKTILRRDDPTHKSTLICDGCRELTARVERLEHALSQSQESDATLVLGTWSCYWICIGMHAFFAFVMFSNETLAQFSIFLWVGPFATLMIYQSMSTRPVYQRALRTMLSVCVVSAAAILGMWLGDIAKPSDYFPILLLYFPPILAFGWIVAKMFVWTRGWRIIPPGQSSQYPKLQIRHLMLTTLGFAGYLGVLRMFLGAEDVELSVELNTVLIMLIYGCVPMGISVAISSLLANIVLGKPRTRHAVFALVSVCGAVGFILTALFAWGFMSGSISSVSEFVVALSIQILPLVLSIVVSSGGTFTMMRLAGYRFANRADVVRTDTSLAA